MARAIEIGHRPKDELLSKCRWYAFRLKIALSRMVVFRSTPSAPLKQQAVPLTRVQDCRFESLTSRM